MNQEYFFDKEIKTIIYEDKELIELIDINTSVEQVNKLKNKLKEKLVILEELYEKKYLDKKFKLDNQLQL